MKEIDARGLACPAPVLQTKAALQDRRPVDVRVMVDNSAAAQNVKRFLESQQYAARIEENAGNFVVIGQGEPLPDTTPETPPAVEESSAQKIMVMAATDRMGFGDDELGQKLMLSFIKILKEMGPELWRLVLVNNGVKLTIDGSPALADLRELEQNGVMILVCGTCLTHFNLLEKKQVGQTTNMLDIVVAMQLADKVVSL